MSDKIYSSVNGTKKELKGEKLQHILQAQIEAQAEQSRIEAEQQAKIQARESAIAKLAALGLTEDEVKAIVGA